MSIRIVCDICQKHTGDQQYYSFKNKSSLLNRGLMQKEYHFHVGCYEGMLDYLKDRAKP